MTSLADRVRVRAYFRWLERSDRSKSNALNDWLEAEREEEALHFIAAPTGMIAIIRSEEPRDLVLVIGTDQVGRVVASSWNATAGWSGDVDSWRVLGKDFPPGAPVTAVTRGIAALDVFAIREDGLAVTTTWTAKRGWSHLEQDWESMGGYFPVGAQVAAVSPRPGLLEAFVVGPDGHVHTSRRHDGQLWSTSGGWRSIGGDFPPGAPITAIAPEPDKLLLFGVGKDGVVYRYSRSEGESINQSAQWRAIGGRALPRTPVTAVIEAGGRVRLLLIGDDGRLYTRLGAGQENEGWRILGDGFSEGASVAAAWLYPGILEVYGVERGGRVRWTHCNDRGEWSRWQQIGSPESRVWLSSHAPIVALSWEGTVWLLGIDNSGRARLARQSRQDGHPAGNEWTEWAVMNGHFFRPERPRLRPALDAVALIHLRTASGRYVCADGNSPGQLSLLAGDSVREKMFMLIHGDSGPLKSGSRVMLRTYDGKFVRVVPESHGDVLADTNAPGPEQLFRIEKVGSAGRIAFGDQVAFRAPNGEYLCVEEKNSHPIRAAAGGRGNGTFILANDEQFAVARCAAAVRLRTESGYLLRAHERAQVTADGHDAEDATTFGLIVEEDPLLNGRCKVALYAFSGGYLHVDPTPPDRPVLAGSPKRWDWEVFELILHREENWPIGDGSRVFLAATDGRSLVAKRGVLPGLTANGPEPELGQGASMFTIEIAWDIHALGMGPEAISGYMNRAKQFQDAEHPILLAPVRLETHFRLKKKTHEFLVRIYPDTFSINAHQDALTEEECISARNFKTNHIGKSDEQQRAAWRELCRLHGVRRAAFLANMVLSPAGFANSIIHARDRVFAPPRVAGLPSHFILFAYQDGKVFKKKGCPVANDLCMLPSSSKDDWTINFEQAEQNGMAIRLELDAEQAKQGFERIIVIGLRRGTADENAQVLHQLLENHRYSDGLAFLEHGTPTNNSEITTSGHSASTENADAAYELELPGCVAASVQRGSNAQMWGWALGLDAASSAFRCISGADRVTDPYTEHMQRALWPATGDYFFRYLLKGALSEKHLEELADHFATCVRAEGPLPLLRVGNQPYGLLPVSTVRTDSQPSQLRGSIFHRGLYLLLAELFNVWLRLADNKHRVPRPGSQADPDKELLEFLAMEPVSTSYRQRPFIKDVFAAYLVAARGPRLFGSHPAFSKSSSNRANWLKSWFKEKSEATKQWQRISGLKQDQLHEMPAFQMLRWWTDRSWSKPLIASKPEEPVNYLRALASGQPVQSSTLLCELLERSLDLAEKTTRGVKPITAAIQALANSTALEFFNSVTNAEEIVRAIRDDPGYGRSGPGTYGVRLHTAQKILEQRNKQPFSSLDEIKEQVKGVGQDTLHDIVTSFDESSPDLDRLLRQSLDLCTHRLDAWVTSLATKQLHEMRDVNYHGVHLGAYGYLENLCKRTDDSSSDGYIHTYSRTQTAAAALLHTAYKTHRPEKGNSHPFAIALNSERVRRALRILDGIRNGQQLGALLGYEFERGLQDRHLHLMKYVDDFRRAYPLVAGKRAANDVENERDELTVAGDAVENQAARNVVDGLRLARAWLGKRDQIWGKITTPEPPQEHRNLLTQELDRLADTLDAVGDLLLYEAVFHTLGGNYERAGAALEAASGNAYPPEIESIKTPVTGRTFAHRVCLTLPPVSASVTETMGPRAVAEPRLAMWFDDLLGGRDQIACSYSALAEDGSPLTNKNGKPAAGVVTLADLDIQAIDVLYMSAVVAGQGATEIEQRIALFARDKHELAVDTVIKVELRRQKEHRFGLGEALELGRRVLGLFAAAPPMQPSDLCMPSSTDGAAYSPQDADELLKCVSAALRIVKHEYLEPLMQARSPGEVAAALVRAARCGIDGAIPSGAREPELMQRRERVRKELERRTEAASVLLTTDAAEPKARIDKSIEACRILFGRGFVILPTFLPSRPEELSSALQREDLLVGAGEDASCLITGSRSERVRLWLQQCAHVHPALRALEDVLLLGEAWSDQRGQQPPLELQPIQLPSETRTRWIALEKSELPTDHLLEPFRPLLSIVLAAPSGSKLEVHDGSGAPIRWAGVVLERWEEMIPEDTVQTSVGFHYDAPSSQAPHCLLLAVPSMLEEPPTVWTPEHLAAIICDTMDLAKARAVDLDAMRFLEEENDLGLGIMLPGLVFPSDRQNPEWTRPESMEEFIRTIVEWANRVSHPHG